MKMKQLTYLSRPTETITSRYSLNPLRALIDNSARRNKSSCITSVFFIDTAAIVQCIEGPGLYVDELFDQILCDDRHYDVKVIAETSISSRSFPDDHMTLLHPLGSYFSDASIDEPHLQKSRMIRDIICNNLRNIHSSSSLTGVLKRMPENFAAP